MTGLAAAGSFMAILSELSTTPFLGKEGLGNGRYKLLVSDDLKRWSNLIMEKKTGIVTFPLEEKISGRGLAPENAEELQERVLDNLKEYFNSGEKKLPILGISVNTTGERWRGKHWETIIVDLSSDTPIIEHWNFKRVDSYDAEKIRKIMDALKNILQNLPLDDFEKVKVIEEPLNKFIPPRVPDTSKDYDEVVRLLKERSGFAKREIYKAGMEGCETLCVKDPYGKMRELQFQIGKGFDQVNRLEVIYPHEELEPFKFSEQFKQVARSLKEKNFTTRFNIANASENRHLLQGINNCGAASSWVVEQRASHSVGEILKMNPGGFTSHRKNMLAELNKSHSEFYPRKEYSRTKTWLSLGSAIILGVGALAAHKASRDLHEMSSLKLTGGKNLTGDHQLSLVKLVHARLQMESALDSLESLRTR